MRLKVLVEHLFPTRRVHAGGVRDHTVEVEQDGVVLLAGDPTLALRLPHRSLSCYHPIATPWLSQSPYRYHPVLSAITAPTCPRGQCMSGWYKGLPRWSSQSPASNLQLAR